MSYGSFHHEPAATSGGRDATNMARHILGYDVHPPTTKRSELVPQAMLTEPAEVEDKASLDDLAYTLNAVYADSNEALKTAPSKTSARHIGRVSAARNP